MGEDCLTIQEKMFNRGNDKEKSEEPGKFDDRKL